MWRKLPLNTKLVASLLLVQASMLFLGALWLAKSVESSRLRELTRRLDSDSDVLESAVPQPPDAPTFDLDNESVRELSEDKDFYFELLRLDGSLWAEGSGPQPDVRRELRSRFQKTSRKEAVYSVDLPSGKWIVQSEPFYRSDKSSEAIGYIHVAINAQPVLKDMADFKRTIALGALGILIATSLGSGFVVSFTTRNIRDFAHRIRSLKPPLFDGHISLAPQSAEEKLLFDSYGEMLRAVRASVETQRLFIAHASHELKTPIAAAFAALEVTLARPRLAKDYEQTCVDVFGEVKALRRLSSTLLNLAHLEAGTDIDDTATCDIDAVSQAVAERWRKTTAENRATITFRSKVMRSPILIQGSAEQWEVVLGNLVDNAVKYGKDGGSVAVELRDAAEDLVEVVIRDDGRGMSADQLGRLGEMFFRADASRTGGESFGLGFAHAKRILDRLGAELRVESVPDRGTLVTIVARAVATSKV